MSITSKVIPSIVSKTNNSDSRTAVHAAAFNDHVECLQLLLRRSAAADIADNLGQTPLMMAAKHGHSNAIGKCTLYSNTSSFFVIYFDSSVHLSISIISLSSSSSSSSPISSSLTAYLISPVLTLPHLSILHLYPSSLSNTDLFLSSVSVELLDMPHIDQSRNTALHLACLQGHEECALAILEKCNDDLIHVSNTAGKT